MKICPVILSGGSGKRLWPLSRTSEPKQFLKPYSESSLLVETIMRLVDLDIEQLDPILVCNEDHKFLIQDELEDSKINYDLIILEPFQRNTSPAITLAAKYLEEKDDDIAMLILPSDHLIKDIDGFHKSILQGLEEIKRGFLCTFGVTPNKPETGYGYIEKEQNSIDRKLDSYLVASFKEKPSTKVAKEYIKSEKYLWNAGIFLFEVNNFLEGLKETSPEIVKHASEAIDKATYQERFLFPEVSSFKRCPSDSVDYSLLEKANTYGIPLKVIELHTDWSDIGSWESLKDSLPQDKNGNFLKGDLTILDTIDSMIINDSAVLTTAIGLENILIVNTKDALLVANLSDSQKVSKLVEQLSLLDREEIDLNREVKRPWGTYDSIEETESFKVKRIKVNPGQKLSLQLHNKRSEHWVMVKGDGHITLNSDTILVRENESIYIPKQAKHTIENRSDEVIEFIEVQTGSYLGEDDIVRFEDKYGRADK